jgi:hypothetical protein
MEDLEGVNIANLGYMSAWVDTTPMLAPTRYHQKGRYYTTNDAIDQHISLDGRMCAYLHPQSSDIGYARQFPFVFRLPWVCCEGHEKSTPVRYNIKAGYRHACL